MTRSCVDRETANEVFGIMQDSDPEVARRLTLILTSGKCSDRLAGEDYEVAELEPSGIIKARLRTYLTVYLLPPMATPTAPPVHGTTAASAGVAKPDADLLRRKNAVEGAR